jgi:hypothetical protein
MGQHVFHGASRLTWRHHAEFGLMGVAIGSIPCLVVVLALRLIRRELRVRDLLTTVAVAALVLLVVRDLLR